MIEAILNHCKSLEVLIIGICLTLLGIVLNVKFKAKEEADIKIGNVGIKVSGFGIIAFVVGVVLIMTYALQRDCTGGTRTATDTHSTDPAVRPDSSSGALRSDSLTVFYIDKDGDGKGDVHGPRPFSLHEAHLGYVANADDCCDNDPAKWKAANAVPPPKPAWVPLLYEFPANVRQVAGGIYLDKIFDVPSGYAGKKARLMFEGVLACDNQSDPTGDHPRRMLCLDVQLNGSNVEVIAPNPISKWGRTDFVYSGVLPMKNNVMTIPAENKVHLSIRFLAEGECSGLPDAWSIQQGFKIMLELI